MGRRGASSGRELAAGNIEFTRAREIYRWVAVGDRIEFGLFRGLRLIHGTAAFRFLDKVAAPVK